MRKRTCLWIGAGGLVAVVAAVALLWLAVTLTVPYNPMLSAFLATFQLKNESGVDLRVTPIGMREGSAKYAPLPRYDDDSPPAWRRLGYDIPLRAGKAVSITYDWDDTNFRHVLVRLPSGRVLMMDTDRKGGRRFCCPPQRRVYVIPKPDRLSVAPRELLPCLRGSAVRYSGAKEYAAD